MFGPGEGSYCRRRRREFGGGRSYVRWKPIFEGTTFVSGEGQGTKRRFLLGSRGMRKVLANGRLIQRGRVADFGGMMMPLSRRRWACDTSSLFVEAC